MRWTLAVDGDSLLDLDVLEDLGPVPVQVKKSTGNGVLLSSRTVRAAQGHGVGSTGVGRRYRAAFGAALPVGPVGPVGPASFDAEVDVDAEGEEFEAVPADVRFDVLEFREASHEEDTADAEYEEDAAEEDNPTPLQLVAAAFEDEEGYVYCGLPPFQSDSKYRVGRLTSWPQSRPPEQRVWRAVCYQHAGCMTPPRLANRVTREQLLLWLFSPCPEGAAASDPPSHASCFGSIVSPH